MTIVASPEETHLDVSLPVLVTFARGRFVNAQRVDPSIVRSPRVFEIVVPFSEREITSRLRELIGDGRQILTIAAP